MHEPSWQLARLFLKRQGLTLDSIEEAELSEHQGHSEEICLNPASLINCSNLILAKRIRYDKRASQNGERVPLGEHLTLNHIHNVTTNP